MKQHITKIIAAVCICTAMTGCKPDMDLNNPAEASTDNYYKKKSELENALIPAYQALIGRKQGGYCFTTLFTLLAPGDDFRRTYKWAAMYQDTYNTPASDEAAKGPWQDWFNGIMAANLAIDKINQFNDKSVSAEELNTMLGQALFLRGLFYLNLASIYGETIPLYDHAIATRDDYYPGNAEKGAVYAQIVADFTKAAELLPVRSKFYSKADNIGRATQGAALGFLAKAYLWRPIIEKGREAEYDKARPVLKRIIDSGEYELNANFRDNFTNDPKKENGKESIFEVQMHNGNSWMGGDLSDSWRWINIGLPDGTGGCWWNLAPTKMAYDEFEEGDPRRYMTLWCPGGATFTDSKGKIVTFEMMNEKCSSDKDLYGTRKACPDVNISDADDDYNDPLMRYADILLMYAECLHAAGKDGADISDREGAKYWIQQVRNRANNVVPTEQAHLWYQHSPGKLPTVDELLAVAPIINGFKMDNVMNLIMHERCVELMGEYYRYFDLMRWGMKDPQYLEPIKKLGWSERKMYLPFPQDELNNDPNLTGNDANK